MENIEGFIANPSQLGRHDADILEDLRQKFPYFQALHVLIAKCHKNQNTFGFNKNLKLASLYAGDRKILYDFINSEETKKEITIEQKIEADLKIVNKEEEVPINSSEELPSELLNTILDEPEIEEIDENTEPPKKAMPIFEVVEKTEIPVIPESEAELDEILYSEPYEEDEEKVIEPEISKEAEVNFAQELPLKEDTRINIKNATNNVEEIVEPEMPKEFESNLTQELPLKEDTRINIENATNNVEEIVEPEMPKEFESNLTQELPLMEEAVIKVEAEVSNTEVIIEEKLIELEEKSEFIYHNIEREEASIAEEIFEDASEETPLPHENESLEVLEINEVKTKSLKVIESNTETEPLVPISQIDNSETDELDFNSWLDNFTNAENNNQEPIEKVNKNEAQIDDINSEKGENTSGIETNVSDEGAESDTASEKITLPVNFEDERGEREGEYDPVGWAEIAYEIQAFVKHPEVKEVEEVREFNSAPISKIEIDDLLDRFIKNNPSISRRKTEFYNPENMARKSEEFHGDLASETLAKLFYKQGHLHKSLEMYEKLMLQNPDKKDNFAAFIKSIKEELINKL